MTKLSKKASTIDPSLPLVDTGCSASSPLEGEGRVGGSSPKTNSSILITGGAGLVGQNLVLLLSEQGFENITVIDKNEPNLTLLKKLNPKIKTISADLSQKGSWVEAFKTAEYIVLLHAQIGGIYPEEFVQNNLTANKNIIEAIKTYFPLSASSGSASIGCLSRERRDDHRQTIPGSPHDTRSSLDRDEDMQASLSSIPAFPSSFPIIIHISSSVVNSVANDDYTNTKKAQEKLMLESGLPCCILRPTLMFGWFDPKHLGWLSRFMAKTPVFPIPGQGAYIRQPLYSRDFCRIILAALTQERRSGIYDIVGQEEISYIQMIYLIKKLKKLKTKIIKIPYFLFYFLLKLYALIHKNPPFTADQLKALAAGDHFIGIDFYQEFGVKPTPLAEAFEETYAHPTYSSIELWRTS